MTSEARKYAIRNNYGFTEYLTAQEIMNLREMGETVDVTDPAWDDGSTMYDRRAREGHEPTGARGEFTAQTGEGHTSQWYDDGYRVSRDTDGRSDSRVHWTNQNVSKGKRYYDERHNPPSDAR